MIKTLVGLCVSMVLGSAIAQKLPLPPIPQGQDDVRQTAILMMRMGGSYEGEINGAFAQALRKQLQDPTVRVTLKGRVLQKLEEGCVWAEFTARTPDKKFATVIKNKTLVYGPFELTITSKYCQNPEGYAFDDEQ